MEQTRRQRRDASAWRSVVSRFNESGLSVPQFCAREGIGAASFYQWRSRLRASGSRRKRRAPPGPTIATGRSDFLDLGTLGPASSRMEVRLELGGGIVVHVTRG